MDPSPNCGTRHCTRSRRVGSDTARHRGLDPVHTWHCRSTRGRRSKNRPAAGSGNSGPHGSAGPGSTGGGIGHLPGHRTGRQSSERRWRPERHRRRRPQPPAPGHVASRREPSHGPSHRTAAAPCPPPDDAGMRRRVVLAIIPLSDGAVKRISEGLTPDHGRPVLSGARRVAPRLSQEALHRLSGETICSR